MHIKAGRKRDDHENSPDRLDFEAIASHRLAEYRLEYIHMLLRAGKC